jgi:TolB-like protein/AraC-like DNA-binding protein/tetratricopeptide (TPR) repeat protein
MNATGRRHHSDELIQKLTQIVLDNLNNEQFGVNELAKRVGMNRSNLYRKVLVLTKKSLSQFIREIRLAEALKLLKEENVTVSEVAYRVGFSNPSYFNTCFHDHFGFPPGEANRVNLENTFRFKKRKKSPVKHRFSSAKNYAFIGIFFFIVIISMATVLFLNRNKDAVNERSIAILPFINDSPDDGNEYFINGIMDELIFNLQSIKDLRIPGRTSVEQYRNSTKSIPEIARELDVNYVIEGSGQRYGNKFRLRIWLVDAVNDKHLWTDTYDEKITELEDFFSIQSNIARSVAAELEAIITPEEKQLIEKVPTTSPTAYYLYQRGREEHLKYWADLTKKDALDRAEYLYLKALEYDSTFALAYTGLARAIRMMSDWEIYISKDWLDSTFVLANIALSYDDQLAEAYVMRGDYYLNTSEYEQALKEYDKAIKLNPNEWQAYYRKAVLYFGDDYIKRIDNLQKAASLHKGPVLPELYRDIGMSYAHAGFKEKAIDYIEDAFRLDDDSANYYSYFGEMENCNGNFSKSIEYFEKSYAIDSTDLRVIRIIAQSYLYNDQFEESLEYYKKLEERLKTLDRPQRGNTLFLMGYAYWVNGFYKKSEYYFNKGLEIWHKRIELDQYTTGANNACYPLAGIYAFRGDRDQAYEYLRLYNQRPRMPLYMVKNFKYSPLFDSIRDEPEFQQFLQDVEAKYQAEHERVRKWLEENDML